MNGITVFGRKLASLLLSAVLVVICGTGYYFLNQANSNLKPVLPPLAAQRNLQDWLESSAVRLMDNEPLFHLGVVTEIYRRTEYKLLWLHNYELSNAGKLLLRQLEETNADNLIEYNYHLSYIQQRLFNLPTRPKEATALDILLTDAFISYAEDVLSNKLTPEYLTQGPAQTESGLRTVNFTSDVMLNPHAEHQNIISLITEEPNQIGLTSMLSTMHPKHKGYLKLREALQHYQAIAASSQWRPIDPGPKLKSGDRHPQIVQLRNLLTLYADFPLPKSPSLFAWLSGTDKTSASDPELFDADLAASLKHFQQRHGKPQTGILDQSTRELLNVPPSQRIKQLAYNMKRWRDLPQDLGERYIWVNLTNFHLDVVHKDHPILSMKVVVGKTSRRTPVMQESINSVVLNPPWNVPRRIMVYDILPQARKNPNYLAERNIRILDGWTETTEIPLDQIDLQSMPLSRFPYRLQQDPGLNNALGTVKFVIPNDYSIYLHDTNHRELFKRDFRALSSGCIRVEKPRELAELLLKGKRGWDRHRIDEVIASGETTYVRLPANIPTYLLYWTAWVDEDGTVQFRDDIYSLDKMITQKPDLETLAL